MWWRWRCCEHPVCARRWSWTPRAFGWRGVLVLAFVAVGCNPVGVAAHADLVEVDEQVGGIGVHPVRAGPLKFFTTVPAGQQPHAERAGAARGEQVPDAVADDDGRAMSKPMRSAAARNRSGSGLAWRIWSRVTSGASAGRPSMSSAGRAAVSSPLVAMAHFTFCSVSVASNSRAPGSGRTVSRRRAKASAFARSSARICSADNEPPVSRRSALTNNPLLIPMRRLLCRLGGEPVDSYSPMDRAGQDVNKVEDKDARPRQRVA